MLWKKAIVFFTKYFPIYIKLSNLIMWVQKIWIFTNLQTFNKNHIQIQDVKIYSLITFYFKICSEKKTSAKMYRINMLDLCIDTEMHLWLEIWCESFTQIFIWTLKNQWYHHRRIWFSLQGKLEVFEKQLKNIFMFLV